MKPKRQKVLRLSPLDHLAMGQLDELVQLDGSLTPMPASFFDRVSPDALRAWAHAMAVYVFPTIELIDWLGDAIGQPAIEIGAGHGGIARALGIPATDSWVQVDDMEIRRTMEAANQPISIPANHVERLEALDAIERYKPHTVIGAYVTQKWRPGDDEGFVYGVDETEVLRRVNRYIVIGNDAAHGQKRIMQRPHRTIRAPWLVTRAIKPKLNAIYIWEGDGACSQGN
jgi:hypothetical protein